LRPGESVNLLGHLIEIGDQFLRGHILIRAIRLIRVGVESQLEPVRTVAPLAFVAVGELSQVEAIGRCVVDVDAELDPVVPVQLAEHRQIERIEKRAVLLLVDIAQKEAVVIDRETVPGKRMPVPDDTHPILEAA